MNADVLPEINAHGKMIKALDEGDECVLTVNTPQGVTYQVVTVERVTKTQIVAGGKRFLISTGMEFGKSEAFHSTRLTPWLSPAEALERAESERLRKARNRLCRELGTMNFSEYYALTDEQLNVIAGWFGLEDLNESNTGNQQDHSPNGAE